METKLQLSANNIEIIRTYTDCQNSPKYDKWKGVIDSESFFYREASLYGCLVIYTHTDNREYLINLRSHSFSYWRKVGVALFNKDHTLVRDESGLRLPWVEFKRITGVEITEILTYTSSVLKEEMTKLLRDTEAQAFRLLFENKDLLVKAFTKFSSNEVESPRFGYMPARLANDIHNDNEGAKIFNTLNDNIAITLEVLTQMFRDFNTFKVLFETSEEYPSLLQVSDNLFLYQDTDQSIEVLSLFSPNEKLFLSLTRGSLEYLCEDGSCLTATIYGVNDGEDDIIYNEELHGDLSDYIFHQPSPQNNNDPSLVHKDCTRVLW